MAHNTLGNFEDTNGTVIGGENLRRVILFSPKGSRNGSAYIRVDDCPKKWAEGKIAEIKSEVTGDGKTLNDHPDIYYSIYGTGDWIVKFEA